MNFQGMVFAALVAATVFLAAEGGSECPPREDIYPCICNNIPLPKKQVFTLISCRHVPNTNSMSFMFRPLRGMHIDRFIMYDSFWDAHKLGGDFDQQMKLPKNWISMLKIKELQIVDSNLSSCFACDFDMVCPNIAPTHVSVINSSSTNSICTLCPLQNKKTSWMACLSRLQNFQFTHNKLASVDKTFFPIMLKEMQVVNLSHNEIQTVGEDSFGRNLPKLARLDLSHNKISDISRGIFGKDTNVLAFLDLSFNSLKKLSSDIFKMTPFLIHFGASNNQLDKLPENDWKYVSKEMRIIDLRENPIHCDCHLIWINCTQKVHVQILGFCANSEYEESPLRRVSKFMSERCEEGEVKLREEGSKRNACLDGKWTQWPLDASRRLLRPPSAQQVNAGGRPRRSDRNRLG